MSTPDSWRQALQNHGFVSWQWPYVGLVLALPVAVLPLRRFFRAIARPAEASPEDGSAISAFQLLLPLVLPMYWLHQFEEHGVDLRGRRYAFLPFLCEGLEEMMHFTGCPADTVFVFAVNALAVNITGLTAWIFHRSKPGVALCSWGVPLVNVRAHLKPAINSGVYNPGLATAMLLFLPGSLLVVYQVVNLFPTVFQKAVVLVSTAVAGLLVHLVLIGSLLLHSSGQLSYVGLNLVNTLNGLLPMLVGLFSERLLTRDSAKPKQS